MEIRMRFKIVGLIILLLSTTVAADTTAKISEILLYEAGSIAYVYPTGGVQNAPACHGSNGDYLSFSMNRPMAKEYLSMLMMAFATQKTVFFRTERNCVDQSASDTIQYIKVTN
jgi:hypothetical protein